MSTDNQLHQRPTPEDFGLSEALAAKCRRSRPHSDEFDESVGFIIAVLTSMVFFIRIIPRDGLVPAAFLALLFAFTIGRVIVFVYCLFATAVSSLYAYASPTWRKFRAYTQAVSRWKSPEQIAVENLQSRRRCQAEEEARLSEEADRQHQRREKERVLLGVRAGSSSSFAELLAMLNSKDTRDADLYYAYLRTEHWALTRTAALSRAGGICARCGSTSALCVHHRAYERLGCEKPKDLIVLCRSCHAFIHDVDDEIPDVAGCSRQALLSASESQAMLDLAMFPPIPKVTKPSRRHRRYASNESEEFGMEV